MLTTFLVYGSDGFGALRLIAGSFAREDKSLRVAAELHRHVGDRGFELRGQGACMWSSSLVSVTVGGAGGHDKWNCG
jgi:hypothetical protein